MSSYVLCIFEGKRTEPIITDNLCKSFLNEGEKIILRASYGANIYNLYKQLETDQYLDTYELIVEALLKRQQEERRFGRDLKDAELAVLDIDDSSLISDIYLIFDYDAHCTNADDNTLSLMLGKFCDSQEQGLLVVSYPMVEAIRHQKDIGFEEELYSLEEFRNYKDWVKSEQLINIRYHNWGAYDLDIWREIASQHLARANYLVNGNLSLPSDQIGQQDIFEQQLVKHIPHGNVAVISSFPFVLFDYYGEHLLSTLTD
jgi:hypothetical protein